LATVVAIMAMCSSQADQLSVDRVMVWKSERKMYLLADHAVVREYDIALGTNPRGAKRMEGDGRTPEGTYILDFKNPDSAFYKSIHISYPSSADKRRAARSGVDPGGEIVIHGQRNGFSSVAWGTQRLDWTDGCIAVTNAEMDELWRLVSVGTVIEIRP
jgi:murein L,D-transpeptidase YafK